MSAASMVGFGPKQAWLAIRDREVDAVIAALGLRDLGSVSWHQGIDLAYVTDDRVAVTPPLAGTDGRSWVLVPGRWWLGSDARPSVAALSAELHTEVQFFSTFRVTESHRWERAVDGVLVRAFAYVGQTGEVTLWWGDPDEHERALGLPESEPVAGQGDDDPRDPDDDFGYDPTGAERDDAKDDGRVDILIDESSVMRLAAAWSIDPTSLEGLPAPGPLRSASADA
jgi:hypothetical protein